TPTVPSLAASANSTKTAPTWLGPGVAAPARPIPSRFRAGAQLSSEEQTALKIMNAELATLSTQFKQNLLKEINASAVLVDTREELAGLGDATIAAASGGSACKLRRIVHRLVPKTSYFPKKTPPLQVRLPLLNV